MTQPLPAGAEKTASTIRMIQSAMVHGRPPEEGFHADMARKARDPSGTPIPFATRLNEDIYLRLKLAALVCKMPLTRYLDLVLAHTLPPVAELAKQVQGGAPDGH